MKKLFLIACLLSSLFAKRDPFSPIEVPESFVIDIDVGMCHEKCLDDFLKKEIDFSLVANFDESKASESVKLKVKELKILFNIIDIQGNMQTQKDVARIPDRISIAPKSSSDANFRVAMVVAKKTVGRYASSTDKSIVAYLLARGVDFELEVFNLEGEDTSSVTNVMNQLAEKGYKNVIAVVTKEGLRSLSSIDTTINIFVPTINRQEMPNAPSNIYFGGINYDKQIDKLLAFSNKKVSIFYDANQLSKELNDKVAKKEEPLFSEIIKTEAKSEYRKTFERNRNLLNDTTIFLNGQIVKNALALSLLTYYDITPNSILSTQISYNPMLFTLTQPKDRERLYIASSIGRGKDALIAVNRLLDSNIEFDWISYSSNLGLEYFFKGSFIDAEPFLSEEIKENQVEYENYIYHAKDRFIKAIE